MPCACHSPVAGLSFSREALVPVLSVAAIASYAGMRIPMGLPGHRGLIWLTLLVVVALVTRRRKTVIMVGAASTTATLMFGVQPWASGCYLAAALMLYAVTATPTLRRRPWLVVPAAAPIHLVALAVPIAALPVWVSPGLDVKLLWHLVFGLVAGLAGWGVALGIGLAPQFGRVTKEAGS